MRQPPRFRPVIDCPVQRTVRHPLTGFGGPRGDRAYRGHPRARCRRVSARAVRGHGGRRTTAAGDWGKRGIRLRQRYCGPAKHRTRGQPENWLAALPPNPLGRRAIAGLPAAFHSTELATIGTVGRNRSARRTVSGRGFFLVDGLHGHAKPITPMAAPSQLKRARG